MGINHVTRVLFFSPFVVHVSIYPSEMVQWLLVAFGCCRWGCLIGCLPGLKHLPGHEATGIVVRTNPRSHMGLFSVGTSFKL